MHTVGDELLSRLARASAAGKVQEVGDLLTPDVRFWGLGDLERPSDVS